jgi:hypothetical protein
MLVNDKTDMLQRSLHGLNLVPATPVPPTTRSLAPTQPSSPHDESMPGARTDTQGEEEWGSELGVEWHWRYLQGGVCVIKSLRSGWSRASAMAMDAASSAVDILEHGSQDALEASECNTANGGGGRGRGGGSVLVERRARGSASSVAHVEQLDGDCVLVEREPIPWQESGVLGEAEWRCLFDAAGLGFRV